MAAPLIGCTDSLGRKPLCEKMSPGVQYLGRSRQFADTCHKTVRRCFPDFEPGINASGGLRERVRSEIFLASRIGGSSPDDPRPS